MKRSPTLNELPVPPSGKSGWPWTEESLRLPDKRPDGSPWPGITVVTPSYNQGQFIEETIRSVLLQDYPNLEYFVMDGASTDDSVEIIKKYSHWLKNWVSEPDSGQSDAINRGLKLGSGLFATWINSDDMLCKNAIFNHTSGGYFDTSVVYVGICLYIDAAGNILSSHCGSVHSLEDLLQVRRVWRSSPPRHITQPEVLFPLELALAVGGLNATNHRTMDYELWGKLFLAGAKFHYTSIPFGMFRRHPNQKTQDSLATIQSLIDTAAKLVTQADCFSIETKAEMIADLHAYEKDYWKHTGRLARIGLPSRIVTPLRKLRFRLLKPVKELFRSSGKAI